MSRRVKIYLVLARLFGSLPAPIAHIFRPLEGLSRAIWLGLLDGGQLNQVTWACYNSGAGFDEPGFNSEHGLWPWESEAVQRHFSGHKRVLVAGAGGGREVIALARLGHEVAGFDFSPALTEACRRHIEQAGCRACVFDAPADSLPELPEIYDALLIGRGFYHHIPGRARRVAFLADCGAVLKPGAPIILSDVFTRPSDSGSHDRTWAIAAIANFVRLMRKGAEPVERGDWLGSVFQHSFTHEELAQEWSSAGLKLETFNVTPFGPDSRLAHAIGSSRCA